MSSTLRRMAQSVLNDRVPTAKPKKRDITARHSAKRSFTDDQVRFMRELHRLGRISAEELSLLTGMAFESILHVLDGTNYSKVL